MFYPGKKKIICTIRFVFDGYTIHISIFIKQFNLIKIIFFYMIRSIFIKQNQIQNLSFLLVTSLQLKCLCRVLIARLTAYTLNHVQQNDQTVRFVEICFLCIYFCWAHMTFFQFVSMCACASKNCTYRVILCHWISNNEQWYQVVRLGICSTRRLCIDNIHIHYLLLVWTHSVLGGCSR